VFFDLFSILYSTIANMSDDDFMQESDDGGYVNFITLFTMHSFLITADLTISNTRMMDQRRGEMLMLRTNTSMRRD